MSSNEFCITDLIKTDTRPRKGLAEFADLQQRSTGIHRSVDDKRGAANDRSKRAERADSDARFDYLKDRVGVEVQLGHSSFVGIDLLKFQIASYANLDTIDFGVYIVTTKALQKHLKQQYHLKWEGSLTFEKVKRYLPYIRSAIQVPVYVIGIDY